VIRLGHVVRVVVAGAAALALVAISAGPALADSTRDRQWYLSALDVARAHQISEGAGVTVALIDTGVDAKHRDLAGAVLPGADLYSYQEGDGTGRNDIDGHGTTMAGIIAGRGHGAGDRSGILGLAPQAKILPIRVLTNGFLIYSNLTKAIDYAVAHHVRVINMSYGGRDDSVTHDAIRKALAADIVVVAAAGNRGAPGGDYPGAYPEVLTVGSIDKNGKISPTSVTGPQVDIVAPGVGIATTGINASGYALGTGTSEATAVVSGAAALIRAKYPDLSAAEVVHRLTATATDAGAKGRDDTYGYGRLDLVKALTADVPPAATPSASPSRSKPVTATPVESDRTPVIAAVVIGVLVIALIGAVIVAVVVRRRN
jgi:type VII secretion-associated serine protease mycosin